MSSISGDHKKASDRLGGRGFLLAVLSGIFFASLPTHAAILCTGAISYLGLHPTGLVQISNGFGIWYVCNLSSTFSTVTPEACRGIYAAALTAQAQQRQMTFAFDLPDGTACSSLGSWVTPDPAPYHIRILE